MLVHPAGDQFVYAVIGLAKAARPNYRVDLVHRLDRDTSGVLVMTKNLDTNRMLKQVLKDRDVEKEYVAVTRGVPDWDDFDVIAPIGSANAEVLLRKAVVEDGQYAHTTFTVEQRLDGLALVSCQLHTGRNHQIRVHLEHLGFPIYGDLLYGQPDWVFIRAWEQGIDDKIREATEFPRQALHCRRMVIPHPNGDELELVASIPSDISMLIAERSLA